jgi:ferredoxin
VWLGCSGWVTISGKPCKGRRMRMRREALLLLLAYAWLDSATGHVVGRGGGALGVRALQPVRACGAELPSYEIKLRKPLGILFGETESDGSSNLVVMELLDGGSAKREGTLWPGDVLLGLDGRDVRALGFDACMNLLAEVPDSRELELEMGRPRGRTAAVRFPDRELVFCKPGDALRPLAEQSAFAEVEYSCNEGTCGACEWVLRDGETEGLRSVRICRSRLPRGESASLMPYELLRRDSEEAVEHFRGLAAREKERRRPSS